MKLSLFIWGVFVLFSCGKKESVRQIPAFSFSNEALDSLTKNYLSKIQKGNTAVIVLQRQGFEKTAIKISQIAFSIVDSGDNECINLFRYNNKTEILLLNGLENVSNRYKLTNCFGSFEDKVIDVYDPPVLSFMLQGDSLYRYSFDDYFFIPNATRAPVFFK